MAQVCSEKGEVGLIAECRLFYFSNFKKEQYNSKNL
jgi:hypothetical protein